VDAQSVSMPRLDKHVPVNTQQWKLCSLWAMLQLVAWWRNTAHNGGDRFSMEVRAATVAMQRLSKQTSTTERMFFVRSVLQLYKESCKPCSATTFRVIVTGGSSWNQELTRGIRSRHVKCDWKASFTCVIQWDCDSFCIEIRCQETTSDDEEF
jgi:hypothetical protein